MPVRLPCWQGPFTRADIIEWFEGDFFPTSLPIRAAGDPPEAPFRPLATMLKIWLTRQPGPPGYSSKVTMHLLLQVELGSPTYFDLSQHSETAPLGHRSSKCQKHMLDRSIVGQMQMGCGEQQVQEVHTQPRVDPLQSEQPPQQPPPAPNARPQLPDPVEAPPPKPSQPEVSRFVQVLFSGSV